MMDDYPEKEQRQILSLDKKPLFSVGVRLLTLIGFVALSILLKDILILGFISLIFAIILSYPIRLFSKWVPRGAAVILTLILLIGGATGLSAFTLPKIYQQGQSVVTKLPKAIDQLEKLVSKVKSSQPMAQISQRPELTQSLGGRMTKWVESGMGAILPAAKSFIELQTGFLFVFFIGVFLAHQPTGYRNALRNLIPKRYEPVYDESYQRVAHGFGRWLIGILISMTIMGTFTGIGLTLAGIENAFFLGTLTFFGTFVPYLGALISAIPGLLIGLSQSFQHFLFACAVYLCVHILEGYIVEPIIMKQAVQIRPAVLLFSQGILGSLFGLLGIVIAAPFIVFSQILIEYLYTERFLHKGKEEPSKLQKKAA